MRFNYGDFHHPRRQDRKTRPFSASQSIRTMDWDLAECPPPIGLAGCA